MQLFLILLLLMYGGKGLNFSTLKQFGPILETFGGKELKDALKGAEELEEVISAVGKFGSQGNTSSDGVNSGGSGSFAGSGAQSGRQHNASGGGSSDGQQNNLHKEYDHNNFSAESATSGAQQANARDYSAKDVEPNREQYGRGDVNFGLDPVAPIADREIIYRLARYFASQPHGA